VTETDVAWNTAHNDATLPLSRVALALVKVMVPAVVRVPSAVSDEVLPIWSM
jgi:hypothetical protein